MRTLFGVAVLLLAAAPSGAAAGLPADWGRLIQNVQGNLTGIEQALRGAMNCKTRGKMFDQVQQKIQGSGMQPLQQHFQTLRQKVEKEIPCQSGGS